MVETKEIALKNKQVKRYTSGLSLELCYSQLDGRTSVAKSIKAIRASLREYVGQATAASEILISRIAYKALKLSLYELASLQNLKNDEALYYLPLSNSLRLDLVALSQLADKPKPPDLSEYLKENYGSDTIDN